MHWVAFHFPRFRHQALSRGHAPPEPEREALEAVAAWACQFTPRVSLEPPREILLEVAGSLHYFGGRWKLLARLRAGLTALGFEARVAEAPAARAALWLARGGGSNRLETLPVAVTGLAPEPLELLASLGVQSIGGLMRLPRDSVVRRFGQRLLDEMDQARSSAAEVRDFFEPPARFSARLQLPAPVSYAQAALFAAGRLLEQMQGFLAARHAGVRSFCLELQHEGLAPTRLQLRLASPMRDEGHLTRLMRERLGALVLKAPIEAILLTAAELEFLPGTNGHLLRDAPAGEEWLRLVERLQSRLGDDAVHGLHVHADHRPELAYRRIAPDAGRPTAPEAQPGPRPLWLLESPRRLRENEFSLLAGPERIDSGWWDGAEAKRDYFIARVAESSLAWIYREREGGWFLHGLFA